MAISATKWLSVCLHYNEPWEELLTKAVKPYIEVVLQTGVAECFYFERSWDRGPNIRLWFKSTEFLLESMLKPNLQEHFQQYFEAKPSMMEAPKYPAGFPENQKWLPNNSVHFMALQSSLEHQAGCPEMPVIERQYLASSRLILTILKEKQGRWSYNGKFSTAIKMHLAMIYACGLTLKEAQKFATWAYENWAAGSNPATEGVDQQQPFQAAFDLQRKDTLSYFVAVWELLKNYRKVENQTFIEWIHANSSANLEISLALDAGTLKPLNVDHVPTEPAWTYYADFMHKTNNRLGIFKNNEGYLYFAMAQCFKFLNHGLVKSSAAEFVKIKAA
ncbi:MAG: hypothetical protein IPM82_07015 [Saprospiraceae bacterium]|nr:hypothetical protein [Saprospiraceae bacterium]